MRYYVPVASTIIMFVTYVSLVSAETIMSNYENDRSISFNDRFPNLTYHSGNPVEGETVQDAESSMTPALWPFSKSDDRSSSAMKPKSIRKAFFLSFLLPGLGETYVGSKRNFLFFGIEAVAWWLYITNTNEGNDIEDDFHRFADIHWNYYDYEEEYQDQDRNYFAWLQYHFREANLPEVTDPNDYTTINTQLEDTVKKSQSSIYGHSVHNLPATKTQQYYEMIGKYPQFIYGWDDIYDPELNPTLIEENETIKYDEALGNIKSPLRMKYEDIRDNSNQKLKAGQRGIHLMLVNRVVSAIDAARLAYKHNKKMDSKLSMIRVQFIQKRIIDHQVPMIMLTKKY